MSIGILNELPIKKFHPLTDQTVNLFSSDKCLIYFISELLLHFVLKFFVACLVSTSIRSISTSSLLAIIRSTSIIISSVFGHLFSRPSLAATYYGLVGCVGLSFKHKIYNFIATASLIFYRHSITDFAIGKLCKHNFFLCFVFVKILSLTGSHV